jgi:hypothetical protein
MPLIMRHGVYGEAGHSAFKTGRAFAFSSAVTTLLGQWERSGRARLAWNMSNQKSMRAAETASRGVTSIRSVVCQRIRVPYGRGDPCGLPVLTGGRPPPAAARVSPTSRTPATEDSNGLTHYSE